LAEKVATVVSAKSSNSWIYKPGVTVLLRPPEWAGAQPIVRGRNGKSYTIFEEDLSYPDKRFVLDRFISYGKEVLKDSAISALVERIENIEKVKNIAGITSLLVRLKKQ
jgi:hypothetical protein